MSKIVTPGDPHAKNPATTLASHNSPGARGSVGNTRYSENLVAFDCAYLQGVHGHILATIRLVSTLMYNFVFMHERVLLCTLPAPSMYTSITPSRDIYNAFTLSINKSNERCQVRWEWGTLTKHSCTQINMPPVRYTKSPADTSTTLREVVCVIIWFRNHITSLKNHKTSTV